MRRIDYKNEAVAEALKEHCPKGIDVYFDNVGGEILDAGSRASRATRASSICGAISQYNSTDAVQGPANYLSLLVNRARMEGIVVFDYADRYGEAAARDGRLDGGGQAEVARGHRAGLQRFPETLLRLFSGENSGKLVLEVAAG